MMRGGSNLASMICALLGLTCAFVAAGTILKAVQPPLKTVVDVSHSPVHRGDLILEVSRSTEDRKNHSWLRGKRHLSQDGLNVAVSSPSLSPSSSPSEEPTAFPTYIIIHDQSPDPSLPADETISTNGSDSKDVATETIPAIMVGLASSIIMCAVLLYASDLRDRHRHEQWVNEQRHGQELVDDNSSQKSTCVDGDVQSQSMTSAGSSQSGFWVELNNKQIVEYKGNGASNMLPPMVADENPGGEDYYGMELKRLGPPDDVSISRVSTLTASLVEGGGYSSYSFGDIEEKASRVDSSSAVTELSDTHRVSHDTVFSSLFKSPPEDNDISVCSSLTNGSGTTNGTPHLLGVRCLDGGKDGVANGTSSLEVSPDTPQVEELTEGRQDNGDESKRPFRNRQPLAQLEQLISRIPLDELSSPISRDNEERDGPEEDAGVKTFLRDIYFVPFAAEASLSHGFEMNNAATSTSHASISKVDSSSPLFGRLFIGDLVLSVNDIDTVGLTGQDVLHLMEETHVRTSDGEGSISASNMTKLTVMSYESDGDSLSEGQESLDFGEPESVVEV